MTGQRNSRRTAFTLLELVLALSIGILLMAGLYFALDVHLKSADAGRSQVDQSSVTRAILKQIGSDITPHLPTMPPPKGSGGGAGGGSGGGGGSSGSGNTGGSTAGASTTSGTGGNTSGSSTTPTTGASGSATATGPYPFNLGVQGTNEYVMLYVSKVPLSNFQVDTANGANADINAQPTDSDLRCICYWLVGSSTGSPGGLARQEARMVTSDDQLSSMGPGVADEMSYVIAKEVIALSFEYFDGTTWQSSWDGTALGPDNMTPIGPPLAIAITITVARSDAKTTDPSDPTALTTRHVVHIPTAMVNPSTAPQGSANSSGTQSSSSGGNQP